MTEPAAAFAAALIAFQKELPAVRKEQSADTGKFSYSYADLTAVTEAGLPKLTEHGLAFSSYPTLNDAGRFVLDYELLHEQGHKRGGNYPLPDPSQVTPQQIGSAITYARRYCFCAVTGLAPGGEDDDGQHASSTRAADPESDGKRRAWNNVANIARQMAWTPERVAEDYSEWARGLMIADASEVELNAYAAYLDEERKRGNREHKQLVAEVKGTTQAGTWRQDNPEKDKVERITDPDPAADEFAVKP